MTYVTGKIIFRKIYKDCKDCQISYNGNRYLSPYQVVGKKVLPKIKHHRISIYDDSVLLISYQEALEKHGLIGDRLFYERGCQVAHFKIAINNIYGPRLTCLLIYKGKIVVANLVPRCAGNIHGSDVQTVSKPTVISVMLPFSTQLEKLLPLFYLKSYSWLRVKFAGQRDVYVVLNIKNICCRYVV